MLSLRRAGQLISRRHSQRSSWRLLDTQCKARDAVPQGSQYPFEPLLTRDFIAKSLYNRESGYFTKDVIYDLPGPLDYARLLGEWHYRLVVKQVSYNAPFLRMNGNTRVPAPMFEVTR